MAERTTPKQPVLVLGASGYVAGELLRLLWFHPHLQLGAAVSSSKADEPISKSFPHLAGAYPDARFAHESLAQTLLEQGGSLSVFSATPHGETATLVEHWLQLAESRRCQLHWVDLSADFRLPAEQYAATYGHPHAAPALLAKFRCALPELTPSLDVPFVAHPGCFTTAATLACAPLMTLPQIEPRFCVSAITGSSGSGRKLSEGTHHPERHSTVRGYQPLVHRHEPEMQMLLSRVGGRAAHVLFAPHSGPFARGIYATVHARLSSSLTSEGLLAHFRKFYEGARFVSVDVVPPSLKEVIGTNRCALSVAARGSDVVICSAIDNLTKGAAGGAVQWMNRLCGWPESTGLELPGLGWI